MLFYLFVVWCAAGALLLWLGMIGIGARLCLWLCEWGHCSSRAYSTGSLADLLLFLRACCLSVDEIRVGGGQPIAGWAS